MEQPIIGQEYHCYLEDRYIGVATFRDDPNIGEEFMVMQVHEKYGVTHVVIQPDKWELVNNN